MPENIGCAALDSMENTSLSHEIQNFLEQSLKIQNEVGVPAPDFNELAKAKSINHLRALEKKWERSLESWHSMLLETKGLYDPLHPSEVETLRDQKINVIQHFKQLPLHGTFSKISSLLRFEEDFSHQMQFRSKLSKNSFICKEFFQQVYKLNETGSRIELLNRIENELKDFENEAPAIQEAFHKTREKDNSDDTKTLKEKLQKKYKEKSQQFQKLLQKNKTLFKKQETEDLLNSFLAAPSFDDMSKLNNDLLKLIQKKTTLHDKKETLSQELNPEKRTQFLKTCEALDTKELEVFLAYQEKAIKKKAAQEQSKIAALFQKKSGLPILSAAEQKHLIDNNAPLETCISSLHRNEKILDEYLKIPHEHRADKLFQTAETLKRSQLVEFCQAKANQVERQNKIEALKANLNKGDSEQVTKLKSESRQKSSALMLSLKFFQALDHAYENGFNSNDIKTQISLSGLKQNSESIQNTLKSQEFGQSFELVHEGKVYSKRQEIKEQLQTWIENEKTRTLEQAWQKIQNENKLSTNELSHIKTSNLEDVLF